MKNSPEGELITPFGPPVWVGKMDMDVIDDAVSAAAAAAAALASTTTSVQIVLGAPEMCAGTV